MRVNYVQVRIDERLSCILSSRAQKVDSVGPNVQSTSSPLLFPVTWVISRLETYISDFGVIHLLPCTCAKGIHAPKTFFDRCRNYQTFTSLLVLLILQQRTSGCFDISFKSLGCNPLHTRHHPACISTIKSLCGILKFPCASSYPSEEASSAPAARDTTSSKWSIDVIWGGGRV